MSEPKSSQGGWFKAYRNPEAMELIALNPNAFVLLYVIAHRARWREGFNAHGLERGEAFLGDFAACGMTRQQYRTALDQLERHGFVTIRTTNRGTIATLKNIGIFDPF